MALSFKKGTAAYQKRREIAEAIARENPGISMESKFKIATAAVEKKARKGRIKDGFGKGM